jgi:two-component system, chemotaxis family, protein-glutamate methylesterase/glutaminase
MTKTHRAIVLGASAGGIQALQQIIPVLPAQFSLPVMIVQHLMFGSDDFLATYLNELSSVSVAEARPGQMIRPAKVYIAPAGYHLLVEENHTLSLSVDLPVNYSIPSIDVLFESAAQAYEAALIGVILTGASKDGSVGLKCIKAMGGIAVVQDPTTAEVPLMPRLAMESCDVDYVLPLDKIGQFLVSISDE